MFVNGRDFTEVQLTTGDELEVAAWHWNGKVRPRCRFVKVTQKGFNIINLDTNRAILTFLPKEIPFL